MYTEDDVQKAWFAYQIKNHPLSEGRTPTEIISKAASQSGDPAEWHERFASGDALLQVADIVMSKERYRSVPSTSEQNTFLQQQPDLISAVVTQDTDENSFLEFFFIGLVQKQEI